MQFCDFYAFYAVFYCRHLQNMPFYMKYCPGYSRETHFFTHETEILNMYFVKNLQYVTEIQLKNLT